MFLFHIYVSWFRKHVHYDRIYSLCFTEAITIKTEMMKTHYYYKLTFCPEVDHDKKFLPAKKEKVELIFFNMHHIKCNLRPISQIMLIS